MYRSFLDFGKFMAMKMPFRVVFIILLEMGGLYDILCGERIHGREFYYKFLQGEKICQR